MRNICVILILLFSVHLSAYEGVPFFRNYPATEYGAHNRNFDVVAGKNGITYFANFEGLLSFDNSVWRMIYTPGYSRITRLFLDSKGVLWVGGYNLIAKVMKDHTNRDILKPIISDAGKAKIGEVQDIFEDKGHIYFNTSDDVLYEITDSTVRRVIQFACKNDGSELCKTLPVKDLGKFEINQSICLQDKYWVLATQNRGLIILDKEGAQLYSVTEANGLCSNSIKRIAEAGNGCIWGVTDNGIFSVYLPSMFSHYTSEEHLRGEVTALQRYRNQLYIGTLQGLYIADGNIVNRISTISQACWQLLLSDDDKLYAATSEGVFEIEGKGVRQLTRGYALSLACELPGQFYIGEMDGIYRLFTLKKKMEYEKMESFDKVTQFSWDSQGGLIAKDLQGNVYYKGKGREKFIAKGSQPADNRIISNGNVIEWRTNPEGKNISAFSTQDTTLVHRWNECLTTLKEKTIRVIYPESDSLLWLGGDFGVIKVNLFAEDASLKYVPQVFIREIAMNTDSLNWGGDYLKEITFRFSSDALPIQKGIEYQYFLEGYDDNWTPWTGVAEKTYTNLYYGTYTFKVRAKDSFDRYSTVKEYQFNIPWPFYLKWYSVIVYILLLVILVYVGIRWRLRKLVREKEALEKIIVSRTHQITKQKNEIEEKSENLEKALCELRHAQADLVRQEKMATVGKLTKGLIDRILNPLNYINNFSHLTSGLVEDLKKNLHSVEVNPNRENYEESMDILDMMTSNLDKIEEHGGNTSRILKAMEEVLKERNKQKKQMDIIALCRQSLTMLREFYKEDINRMCVSLQVHFSMDTLTIQGNEEQLSKTFMSLLSNGMYAISKKYNKQAYAPEIGISVELEDGFVLICLEDNGIGIEESIREQIFDPFFTTKTTGEAAGVGLFLSKEIITNHNGSIRLDSQKGEYTKFIIKLPIE